MATLSSRAALIVSTDTAKLKLTPSDRTVTAPASTGTASNSQLTTTASSNTIQATITGRLDVSGSTESSKNEKSNKTFTGSTFTFSGATTGTNARTLSFASIRSTGSTITGTELTDKVIFGAGSASSGANASLNGGNDSIEFSKGSADSGSTYNMGVGQDSVVFKAGSTSAGDTIDLGGTDFVADTVIIEKDAAVTGLTINNFGSTDILKVGGKTYNANSNEVIGNKIAGIHINFQTPPA